MSRLTDLDRRLISVLRKDGRAPVAALATQLGVSRATVSNRIEKLKARGVIVGFGVRIRDPGDRTATDFSEILPTWCQLESEHGHRSQISRFSIRLLNGHTVSISSRLQHP